MPWWKDIARLFSSGDDDDEPGEEEHEEAETIDEFTREGGEGEEYFDAGVNMGTVPATPQDYEGPDTGEHPATKPWWQFW